MTFLLTLRGNQSAQDVQWTEHVMNETVRNLYIPGERPSQACWYFVGDGVTVWRESDGHSPVEPMGSPIPFQETDQ